MKEKAKKKKNLYRPFEDMKTLKRGPLLKTCQNI